VWKRKKIDVEWSFWRDDVPAIWGIVWKMVLGAFVSAWIYRLF